MPRDGESDDKPDLTSSYLKELNTLWFVDSKSDEKPLTRFLIAMLQHVEAIFPYFEDSIKSRKDWFERINAIYRVMEDIENAQRAARDVRFYSVPRDLEQREISARFNLSKEKAKFDAAMQHYPAEIDRREEEIREIGKIIQLIESTVDTQVISNIKRPANAGRDTQAPVSGVASIFKRKPKNVVVTKEQLLEEYKQHLAFQRKALEIFRNDAPTKSSQQEDVYLEALADIKFHWLDFYSCLGKEVMMHCMRAYVLAYNMYYQVYLEYPNEEDRELIHVQDRRMSAKHEQQTMSHDEQLAKKAKVCFLQMLDGMKSNLLCFYCLQPNRRDFNKYLDNFKKISDSKSRQLFLAGNEDPVNVEKVFPNFQTPIEAFGAIRMIR